MRIWRWILIVALVVTPSLVMAEGLVEDEQPHDHPGVVAEQTADIGVEVGAWEWLFNAPADEIWEASRNCHYWDRPSGWGEGWFGWLDRLFVAFDPACGWRP